MQVFGCHAVNLKEKFVEVKNNRGEVFILKLGSASALLVAQPHKQWHWRKLAGRLLKESLLWEDFLCL